MDGSEFESRAQKLFITGANYHKEGNADAARLHYDAALLLEPDHPLALQNLCGILYSSNQVEAALSVGRRAIKAAPNNAFARANYAAALMHGGQFERAEQELKTVLKAAPDAEGVWANYALCLISMGRGPQAETVLDHSFKLNPSAPIDRQCDRSLIRLWNGKIKDGIDSYECRWEKFDKNKIWDLGKPEWKGENLSGKTLLIHHEQGFGDSIMLARFAKRIQQSGIKTVVAVPSELVRLFQNAEDFPPTIDWAEAENTDFDYHSPMLSLMSRLDVSVDQCFSPPYFRAEPWAEKIGPDGKLKIGLCWASGDHGWELQRRRRVVPLDLFFPLAEFPGIRLISLQKGEPQKDILNFGAEAFIYDSMGKVADFYDTARIIETLDIVISVDSAVAHLAGALGKPVLMLGPFVRCWRWWRQPSGMPWYRNFKISAQESWGSWKEPVRKVRREIESRFSL